MPLFTRSSRSALPKPTAAIPPPRSSPAGRWGSDRSTTLQPPSDLSPRALPSGLPEIRLQLSRLVLEQRPDDFGGALAGGEHGVAGQIEGRVLLVRAGLLFQRLLCLAVDDAADPRPVDRASAHRAGLSRSVECAAREERKVVGARRARGE